MDNIKETLGQCPEQGCGVENQEEIGIIDVDEVDNVKGSNPSE